MGAGEKSRRAPRTTQVRQKRPDPRGDGTFAVVIGIRIRLVISQFVFEHGPSGSEAVKQRIEQLLVLLKAWATLAAFYDDFTQPPAFKAPAEVAGKTWQDLPLAQAVARETQDAARALLVLIDKNPCYKGA
jgi:hypothetical protein